MAVDESTTPPTPITPIPTPMNVTALAKRLGLDRRTVQRRLARGWVPPTGAATKRKKVQQQVRQMPQVTHEPTAEVMPQSAPHPDAAAVPHGTPAIAAATLVAALALATCSAAFSISGLTSIFAGAFWDVVGMGAALEIGKLSAVAWLGQRHGGRALRLACSVLVLILMALNSVGVYGFLSRAHIEHALAGDLTVTSKTADIDARMGVQASIVADLDRRIAQVNQAVEKSIARGNSRAAMALVEQQKSNRADLTAAHFKETKALADLQVEKAKVDGERKAVEADLGPVRYLATLLGSTDEQTMRWFILVVALLLDPAAVLLLLAATKR